MRAVARAYREAFSGLPREVWLLAGAMLVNRAGSMVLPFLALYVTAGRGLPQAAAAAAMAAYGGGAILGSWLGGVLCGRLGAVRVQKLSLAGAGCAYFAIPLAPGLPALLVATFLASSIADMFRPAMMTAVADSASDDVRTRALALTRLAANLGFALGPSLGGILAGIDYTLLFAGDAVTCWLAALLLHVTLPRARRAESAPAGSGGSQVPGTPAVPARGPFRDPPFLALLAVCFGLVLVLFQTFSTLPLFLHAAYGLPERTVGLLLGLNGLLVALFEMVLVRRLEHRDPLRVMALGMLLLCAGPALLTLGTGAGLAAAALAVLTLGEMLSLPMSNALAATLAPRGARGAYLGAYSTVFAAAFVLAPALGIFVLERFGGAALWWGVGLLGPPLALACLALAPAFARRPALDA